MSPRLNVWLFGCVVNPGAAGGGTVIVKTVRLLGVEPPKFVATARKVKFVPAIANVVLTVKIGVAVPASVALSVKLFHVVPPSGETCHWIVGAGAPLAPICITAFCPAVTV